MVIAGIVIDHADIRQLNSDFVSLKTKFYPGVMKQRGSNLHSLACSRIEIKGATLRRWVRDDRDRRKSRQALMFLGSVLSLLERYHAQITGRVWVKAVGVPLKPTATFAVAVQDIGVHFQHMLTSHGGDGLIVIDRRDVTEDGRISHSVFTQKHQAGGDSYPSIIDSPLFASSDNHVGLQLADIVASGLIFPMAVAAYHAKWLSTQRNGGAFQKIRTAHGPALKRLRYCYVDEKRPRGGIVVSDPVGRKSSGALFA